jgi:hypothetical protein
LQLVDDMLRQASLEAREWMDFAPPEVVEMVRHAVAEQPNYRALQQAIYRAQLISNDELTCRCAARCQQTAYAAAFVEAILGAPDGSLDAIEWAEIAPPEVLSMVRHAIAVEPTCQAVRKAMRRAQLFSADEDTGRFAERCEDDGYAAGFGETLLGQICE